MQRHIKAKQYLETICSQIRCQKVHAEICEEIENHINDQQEAFKAQGIDGETATLKAVAQMGDPVIVGTELDRIYRPKPEWSVVTLTFLFLLTGILLRFLYSPQEINGWGLFCQQLIFPVAGIVLMALCYFLDFTSIGKYSIQIFLSLAAITIVITSLSRFMIDIKSFASCLILLFPVAFAGIVYGMRNKGYVGIVCCGIFFAISAAICLRIPSAAALITLSVSCLSLLTVAIIKNWFRVSRLYAALLVYIPAAAVFGILFWQRSELVIGRFKAAFGLTDPLDIVGYTATVIRQLLSGAKFIGQGTLPPNFNGTPAPQFLPDMNSSFLLTYTIHQFGWLAFGIVVALSIIFLVRILILCTKQKNVLAILSSTAVITTILVQMLFYIIENLGFYVFAPMSWPLISQGNSYLLINTCLVGILLSVFRTGFFLKDKTDDKKGQSFAQI